MHIDLAGPVWNEKKRTATGFGIATLVEWVLKNSSQMQMSKYNVGFSYTTSEAGVGKTDDLCGVSNEEISYMNKYLWGF